MSGAIEIPGFRTPMVAGEDLSGAQFCFVTISADMTVIKCNDTAKPFGILQNNPSLGEQATVMNDGVSKIKIGSSAMVAGDNVSSSNTGTAVASTTGDYVTGTIIVGASAGAIGSISFSLLNPTKD
jgi:hypothetical protein